MYLQTGSGAQPASFPKGTGGCPTTGLKRSGHETDQSPPSNAKVKTAWSYTFTQTYVFMACCLVKYRIHLHAWYLIKPRDNFTFTLPSLCKIYCNLKLPPVGSLLHKLSTFSPGNSLDWFRNRQVEMISTCTREVLRLVK
jgi:hypothetical protein